MSPKLHVEEYKQDYYDFLDEQQQLELSQMREVVRYIAFRFPEAED